MGHQFAFLQRVNFVVDLIETFVVGSAEVGAARGLGNLFEGGFVDLHFYVVDNGAKGGCMGVGSLATSADSHRINTYSQAFC